MRHEIGKNPFPQVKRAEALPIAYYVYYTETILPSHSSMKVIHIIMRVLFGLVLLLPVLGALNVFPAPTADMYTPQAWAFMQALTVTGYMLQLIGLTGFVGLVLVIIGRTALAAVIIAPLSLNVALFHITLDHSPLAAVIPGTILVVCNVYFLWAERKKYRELW